MRKWLWRFLVGTTCALGMSAHAWAGSAADRPSDQQRIAYWQNILNDKPEYHRSIEEGWQYRLEPRECEPDPRGPTDYDLICHTWYWMKAPDETEWGHLTLASLWVKGPDGWREWKP